LGNGRCGKTSILGTLAKRDLNPEEKSTRGIEVDPHGLAEKTSLLSKRKMGYPDMELTWWDFAGQLEAGALRRCFQRARRRRKHHAAAVSLVVCHS
jgi:GTPase SAR1 family protein